MKVELFYEERYRMPDDVIAQYEESGPQLLEEDKWCGGYRARLVIGRAFRNPPEWETVLLGDPGLEKAQEHALRFFLSQLRQLTAVLEQEVGERPKPKRAPRPTKPKEEPPPFQLVPKPPEN